jgi:hypothetical protein
MLTGRVFATPYVRLKKGETGEHETIQQAQSATFHLAN